MQRMINDPDPSVERNAGDEAELLARKALGMALNSIWANDPAHVDASPRLAPTDPTVARRAKILLKERVPPGRELSLALDLLDTSAREAS